MAGVLYESWPDGQMGNPRARDAVISETSVIRDVHSAAQPGTPNDAQARPRRRVGAGGHL